MLQSLDLRFALHDHERGRLDDAQRQPPVLRLDGPWSAAQLEAAFAAQRESWFADDLRPFADNIAAVLAQERELSERWEGLPGADHPALWDGIAGGEHKARPQRRAADRLAVWHPPLAWLIPVVRHRPRELQVQLPLAGSLSALQAMAQAAMPPGWERHRVAIRLELETRVYWGAHSVERAWQPCRRRGDGVSRSLELFSMKRGRVLDDSLQASDLVPTLRRRLGGGVGLVVAVPVVSFERERRWTHVVRAWWKAVWRRIGWVTRDDRDPTFVQRLEQDEPFWNAATGARPLPAADWHKALRDGALLRPASAAAARHAAEGAGMRHVVLVHGGLSCVRHGFGAWLPAAPDAAVWPAMPLLDEACTWRFEHDSFVPIRHNVARLQRWLAREVIGPARQPGSMVLIAHSRGGNVVRFALDGLRRRFPGWRFSAMTAGSPHLGTQVFGRIGQRWSCLAGMVGLVRGMAQGWLGREQLAQLVILQRGLAYEVPPGFHDVEPEGVARMASGRPQALPEGMWLWGSEWGPGRGQGLDDGLWDWLVEDIGGAEVGGDGLVARHSALAGRVDPAAGGHDASPVFHTQYFAHAPTRAQMAERLARLLGDG